MLADGRELRQRVPKEMAKATVVTAVRLIQAYLQECAWGAGYSGGGIGGMYILLLLPCLPVLHAQACCRAGSCAMYPSMPWLEPVGSIVLLVTCQSMVDCFLTLFWRFVLDAEWQWCQDRAGSCYCVHRFVVM